MSNTHTITIEKEKETESLLVDCHNNLFVYNETTGKYDEWVAKFHHCDLFRDCFELEEKYEYFTGDYIGDIDVVSIKKMSSGNFRATISFNETVICNTHTWNLLLSPNGDILHKSKTKTIEIPYK